MEKTRKFTTIVLYVLMAISVVLFVIMITGIDSETNPSDRAKSLMALNINWAIALFVIAAIIALGFALIQMFSEKRKALSALAVIGIFAVMLIISYALASSQIPTFFGVEKFVDNGSLTETISKWIGTGLYVTYILFAGAFLAILGFGAVNVFKRS